MQNEFVLTAEQIIFLLFSCSGVEKVLMALLASVKVHTNSKILLVILICEAISSLKAFKESSLRP
jgi:hypothetical protein